MRATRATAPPAMVPATLYERDFAAWTADQAAALRAGRIEALDIAHLAQEIEDMGRDLFRALRSRLRVLMQHLLKLEHQPSRRTRSWETTVLVQRDEIATLLDENPSLRRRLGEAIAKAYPAARKLAAKETGLAIATFPAACPFDEATLLDAND